MKAREMQRLRMSFYSKDYSEKMNKYLKALKQALKVLLEADKKHRKKFKKLKYTTGLVNNTVNFIKNTLQAFPLVAKNTVQIDNLLANEIVILNSVNACMEFITIYTIINKSIYNIFYLKASCKKVKFKVYLNKNK